MVSTSLQVRRVEEMPFEDPVVGLDQAVFLRFGNRFSGWYPLLEEEMTDLMSGRTTLIPEFSLAATYEYLTPARHCIRLLVPIVRSLHDEKMTVKRSEGLVIRTRFTHPFPRTG